MKHAPMRIRWLVAGLLLLLLAVAGSVATPVTAANAQTTAPPGASPASIRAPVVVIPLKGAVSPASANFILRGMTHAREAGAQLIVLEMDTPGGLDLSMREIIQAILASPVPVASFVYPGGSRAASAGTYILYASHIAAMAPGTNLGAASPVQIGIGGPQKPEAAPASAPASAPPQDTMERKQMQDASAYIRGLAQLRGRNAEWGERAVREAVSLSADEAVAQHVADLVALDLPALLRAVDGRRLQVAGVERVLHTAQAPVQLLEPDWRDIILAVITDPSVALILMMAGIYGLIFEFSTPGMVVPGIGGAICLLLALFALHMLPVNYAGLGLIALGIGCMVAELYLPTFGALGVGGIIAFIFGAVMLIDTNVPGFGIPLWLIGSLALASAVFLFAVWTLLWRARRMPAISGGDAMIGTPGVVLEDLRDDGWAEIRGERWRVHSTTPLARGQRVLVTGRHGLLLEVRAVDAAPIQSSTQGA
jgi:membrane-bound serine protease (ClpP class)